MPQTAGTFSALGNSTEYREVFTLLQAELKELKAIWKQYYNVKPSDRRTEVTQSYVEFGDVPEKAEGANYATDLIRTGYEQRITHTEFGLGFETTETAQEDDRFNVLKRNTKWLAYSARYLEEQRAARPLNNGFSSEVTPDAVSVFNSAHVLAGPGAGTVSNILATASDLAWNSLAQAMIDAQTQTRSESGKFVAPVTGWDLIVPPALEFTAARILNSTLMPGVADNDKNVLKDRRQFTLIVNPHLTDTDAWMLLASEKTRHGFCSYTRIPITMVAPMIDSRTGNTIWKVRLRRSWFVEKWQNSFATPGA